MFSQKSIDSMGGTSTIAPPHHKTLQELSRTEKLILTLTYYEGLTLRETGIVLGFPEAEVRSMLSSIEEKFARVTELSAL